VGEGGGKWGRLGEVGGKWGRLGGGWGEVIVPLMIPIYSRT
jgi:hypothetical protein